MISGPDYTQGAHQVFQTMLGNDPYSIGHAIGKVQDGDSLFNFIVQSFSLKTKYFKFKYI